MSSEREETFRELSRGTFKIHKHPLQKEFDIKDITEKRIRILTKILHSTLNPSPPNYTTRERLYQEKCGCIFITQYTDQLIQYEASLASENFWKEQRTNNSSQ